MRRGVLFVSPHANDAETLKRMLEPLDVPLGHAANLKQAGFRLEHDRFGVVLTEATLPDGSWLEVMDLARRLQPSPEVIVTHPFADSRFWAEALSLGAYDLLAQPFYAAEVQRIVSNACTRPNAARAATAAVI